MDIYIDILFAINFTMNLLIFFVSLKLAGVKRKLYKIILGAGVSAFLYCIMIITPLIIYFNFFSSILILILGLAVALGKTTLKKFALIVVYAHLVAFMIGGMAIGIYNYININLFLRFLENFSMGLLLISVIISYAIMYFGYFYIQNRLLSKQTFCSVKIFKGGEYANILALVDTGNTLVEPISKWPVIIAEQDSILNLLKDEDALADKLRLIPYKTVGKEGLLTGFRPDKVEIENKGKNIIINEVVIGLCDFNLGKQYQGLLNPKFLAL